MKIQQKLTLCFLFVSLLTVAVGLSSHWQLMRIANPLRGGVYTSVEQLGQTLAINDRAQRIHYASEVRYQSLRNYAFTGERRFKEQYHLSRAEIMGLLRPLSQNNHFPIEIFQKDLALASIEQEAIQKVDSAMRSEAVSILGSSVYENLKTRSKKLLREYFLSIGASYEKAYESAVVNVKLATERTDKIIRDSIKLNMIMVFSLLVIAVVLSFMIGRSIAAPISGLTKYVAGISAGLSEGKRYKEISSLSKDEIGELTRSFSKMTQDLQTTMAARDEADKHLRERGLELESVNKELEAFTYTVSHDLRAPLRAISAFASFLKEDCKDQLTAVGLEHLSEIKKGVGRMTGLIDDLITLSRVSRVHNPYEAVDMNQVVERAKNQVVANFPEMNAAFFTEGNLPTVYCDPIKLEVAYVNLLSNAVKFSAKTGQSIKVTMGCKETTNEYIFYVADNGIGIEARYHGQIFELFKRLHTQQEYDGTGAGLSIVKKIIEDHKGKITVESDLGKGAKFIFTLNKQGEAQI